jgi:hypothetical protein
LSVDGGDGLPSNGKERTMTALRVALFAAVALLGATATAAIAADRPSAGIDTIVSGTPSVEVDHLQRSRGSVPDDSI